MDYKTGIVLPTLLVFLVAFVVHTNYANGFSSSSITIVNPVPNVPIFASSLTISGTFTTTGTVSEIGVSIDGGTGYVGIPSGNCWTCTLVISGNGWEVPVSSIASGWHTITANLVDSTGTYTTSEQIIIIAGHVTISRIPIVLVEYSESCNKLLKINDTTACPSLEKLMPFDTTKSFPEAGYFVKKNNQWSRTAPQVSNYWNYIIKDSTTQSNSPVCVDCFYDLGLAQESQLIYIEPSNFVYTTLSTLATNSIENTPSNSNITINEVGEKAASYTTTRYVSPDCTNANLVFDPSVLADTIAMFENGCLKTNFNFTKSVPIKNTPFDLADSVWLKYQAWLTTAKQVTQYCISGCNTKNQDPFHNKGFGWK